MDKKNTTIGVLLLLAAMASFYFSAKYAPKAPAPLPVTQQPVQPATAPAVVNGANPSPVATQLPSSVPAADLGIAETVSLANDFIIVTLTNHGGAIDNIALKKHLAVAGQSGLYTLNSTSAAPALSLRDFPGADRHTAYTLETKNASTVVYRATSDTLEITRRYTLEKSPTRDDYQIRHETTFRNLTDHPLILPKAVYNLGTAAPLNESDYGIYLTSGYSDGKDTEFVARGDLEGGGFLSMIGLKDGTPLPSSTGLPPSPGQQ